MCIVALLMLFAPALWAQTAAPAAPNAAPATAGRAPSDIVGTWQGTLRIPKTDEHPQIDLRLIFKISRTDTGALKAVWYSIDQGGQPSPIATVNFQDGVLKFTVTVVPRSYEGKMSEDGKAITGTWMEDKTPIALPLERANADTAWAIPEPPKRMPANANPAFDVATIKPGEPGRQGKLIGFRGREFSAMNFNVNDLISFAYGLHTEQIIGAPPWFATDLYDITGVPDIEGIPSQKQQNIMLQKLLADRFQLKFHHEQKELPVYVITVAKGGPKMTVDAGGPDDPIGFFFRGLGDLTVRNLTMADFATWFQGSVTDKPVVDHTGLTDRYDFNFKWTPDDSQFVQFRGSSPLPTPRDDAPPSLYTAAQEQLGLKFESTKAPDDVIVIDHVEKPSPN
jgi:uncharacterized protein (TIGR03435 family)